MIKKILMLLVLVVVGIVGYASTKPAEFTIQRTAPMKATPEKIQEQIVDFHKWSAWSPWEKIDPNLKRTYSGAPSGKGAIYEWEGNNEVGKGRMEIADIVPASKVTIKLDFFKPFEAHNTAEFTTAAKGDTTDVNWAMSGKNPLMAKVMCLFFDMDKMVGKDFERGLANLKTVVEAGAPAAK